MRKIKNILVWFLTVVISFIVMANVAFAVTFSDGSSDHSAVAKFQNWLRDRDSASQDKLTKAAQQNNSQTGSDSSASSSAQSSQPSAESQEAFKQMSQQAMPMTSAQIRQFRQMVDQTKRASAYSLPPPKPISSTLVVNLAPGSTPPAIRLYQGFISSLVFVDSSGATWPIESYDLGNNKAFNIQWDQKSNLLMVQPQAAYDYANLAVKLKGLSTPVMMTLVPGQSTVDYRVDLRINGLGPNAKGLASGSSLPGHADTTLLGVLDGVSPQGSTRHDLDNGAGTAWIINDTVMYVRTKFTMLSPGYISVMTSPDGTHAYKLQVTPSILVSFYGKPVELKVKGV
jgi:intracellular multiplication protein IcmK